MPSRLPVFEVVLFGGVDEGVGRSRRGGGGVVCMLTGWECGERVSRASLHIPCDLRGRDPGGAAFMSVRSVQLHVESVPVRLLQCGDLLQYQFMLVFWS